MNWNKFFAPYKAWRERAAEWMQTQPEYASIVSCQDYFRDRDHNRDTLESWTQQAALNQQTEQMLLRRYQAQVEPMPNVNCTVVLN